MVGQTGNLKVRFSILAEKDWSSLEQST